MPAEITIDDRPHALACYGEVAALRKLRQSLEASRTEAIALKKLLGDYAMCDVLAQIEGAIEATDYEIDQRNAALDVWDSRHEPTPVRMKAWLEGQLI